MKARTVFNLIIVFCLSIAALLVLLCSVFTTIYYDMHMDVDWPQYGKENILLLLILLAAVFVVFAFFYKKKFFEEKPRIFRILAFAFLIVYCLFLILVITPLPVNDSKTLDNIINAFMAGDYSELTSPGGYLFYWPYQLGYVFFGQVMARAFGIGNYFAWDILQLISIFITVYLLYKITWELFGSKIICSIIKHVLEVMSP